MPVEMLTVVGGFMIVGVQQILQHLYGLVALCSMLELSTLLDKVLVSVRYIAAASVTHR
jgi:hypothetical protein